MRDWQLIRFDIQRWKDATDAGAFDLYADDPTMWRWYRGVVKGTHAFVLEASQMDLFDEEGRTRHLVETVKGLRGSRS